MKTMERRISISQAREIEASLVCEKEWNVEDQEWNYIVKDKDGEVRGASWISEKIAFEEAFDAIFWLTGKPIN